MIIPKIKEHIHLDAEKEKCLKAIMSEEEIHNAMQMLKIHSLITYEHSINVARRYMQIVDIKEEHKMITEDVVRAALLLDIGYLTITKEIIEKKDNLTQEEYQTIKKHVIYGETIAKDMGMSDFVCSLIKTHHERKDGSGYLKLSEDEVDINAFLLGAIDVYEAMIEKRPYRKGMSEQYVVEQISRNTNEEFPSYVIGLLLTGIKS